MDGWKPPQKLPFSKKKLPTKVVLSYIVDYVIIIVLIIGFYALDAVEPFHQHFALANYTLHYPYAVHERVPILWAVVIAVVCPAIIIAIYTLVIDGLFSHQRPVASSGRRRRLSGTYRLKDRLWELNCGILGLLLATAAAFTITGALKNAIGKPRPDLLARCLPPPGSVDPPFGLSDHSICTQKDNAILKDGFRSFPSGHSSSSFAGLFYLSLYLSAKLHVLDSRGEVWKTFVIMVPTLGAALIAGSRIMDARHHPFDVITGSLLGILVAWGSYRQYFPPVTEPWHKGRAYPIRSWGREPVAPEVIRVDEAAEPLRVPIPAPADIERGATSGYTSPTLQGIAEEHGGNVFRQQVSASQRRRAEDAYRGAPSSAYSVPQRGPSTVSSTYTSTLPTSNPFAAPTSTHRGTRQDGYFSSSSEDEDEYELQPTYTLSNPHGGGMQGAYDPVAATFGADTGYHREAVNPVPSPPLALNAGKDIATPATTEASGDLAETSRSPGPPPPPAHAAGTTGESRGVQLTESYAK
ncbi:PAP2-domain-containing protein [Lepidopterella palustris CBS 459.81]|uniref:PAP2-domain-containing protein n=1 Tax=Lepidopterella palustris CBS 459.81 TaxID=1314670 RepID=A0A8E2EDU7_9PEZI|nr:PAP2-domain-containing protein [Lepidopterella palustris CBS 459.81]